MKFEDSRLQVLRRTAYCECGGVLTATSMVLASFPPQYPHKCNNCGMSVNLDTSYPTVMYGEASDE